MARKYKIFGKTFASKDPFDRNDPTNLVKICTWLTSQIAPSYAFLLPDDPVQQKHALANLRALPMNELLYLVATLQETHRVPAYVHENLPKIPTYTPPTFDPALPRQIGKTNSIPPFLALVPSRQPKAGLGIVNACSDAIPADQLLGWYWGEILSVSEGRRRAQKDDNAYIMLLQDVSGIDLENDYAIDLCDRTRSTWTRFVNEARHVVENARYKAVDYALVELTTTQPIAPGDEVLCRYDETLP